MKNKLESLLGDLMRKIQDVIYARGDANLHAKVVSLEYVTKCWKSGKLPYLIPGRKKNCWVVGFERTC